MECRRHRTGPDSDEIPRRRRTGLVRDNQTDLGCWTGRPGERSRAVTHELLRATAWRTSALNADSSTSSPSWMSIARRTFPSRLELKRRAGSFRNAPLAKVSFTAFL